VAADPLAEALARIVGPADCLTDPDLTAGYRTDWTGRFTGPARCVVRPGTTDEVAAVMALCAAAGQAVVPQGGNTGLVGGGVPRGGEVVLSLSRLVELEAVDPVGGTVVAGAGVTLAALQAHALAAGWDVGIDFASRDSATVGGLVATNAGGTRVLRHGDVRAQIRGVEAVTAAGVVVDRMTRLPKDSTGYDLPGLLVGSEGTLAVVTRVVWRLVPPAPERVTALFGLASYDDALTVLGEVRTAHAVLGAAETFGRAELELVRRHAGLAPPLRADHPRYVLLECEGRGAVEALARVLDGYPLVAETAVAVDAAGRAALWAYRERITECINAEGVPVKLDVAVPPTSLGRFEERVPEVVAGMAPNVRVLSFGHLAEGNLHVNLLDATEAEAEAVEGAVLTLVAGFGGSISAEHGVGIAKRRWLHLTRNPEDIAVMRAIKDALDPHGLLNPGVLLAPAADG